MWKAEIFLCISNPSKSLNIQVLLLITVGYKSKQQEIIKVTSIDVSIEDYIQSRQNRA
jgi:hypothetical protein